MPVPDVAARSRARSPLLRRPGGRGQAVLPRARRPVLDNPQGSRRMSVDDLLIETMPALRRYAMKLTHHPERAIDLVGDTTVQILRNRALFQPGTNFAGWSCTIMKNLFCSGL